MGAVVPRAGSGSSAVTTVVTAGEVALEYLAAATAGLAAGALYLWFAMEAVGQLRAAAALAFRVTRGLLLGIGWVGAVGRIVLG